MNDNDVTKNFYRNKPASLIAELLFLLTYHSSPLVFSVYHEFLLTVKSFLFLLALRGHLLHLLRQLPDKHKSKLTTMMQIMMKKRNLKRKPVNSRNNRAIFVWPWKMVSVSVRSLFHQQMDEKIETWPLRFPAKENPNMEQALFDWPIMLQYDKAKYRLISRKFSCMKFFHPTKSHARLYPFYKPIKSSHFRSFVVSVLFARFHFKVVRKSLYGGRNN